MMIIDDREPDWVKNHDWDFRTEVEVIDVGDFLLRGGVAVERKEINDFVSSIPKRLWEQLENMEINKIDSDVITDDQIQEWVGVTDHLEDGNGIHAGILLIHGRTSDLNSRNMQARKIEAIYGALARVMVSYDVSTSWFRGRSQFFKMMNKLHSKGGDERSIRKPHLTKRDYRDQRVNILFGIDGLGYKTINNIFDVPGLDSVLDVAQADTTTLAKADGVGPKTAQRIYDNFREGSESGGLL